MFFILSQFIIFFISFGLALVSLFGEMKKTEHQKAKEVQKDLAKGRVIFYSPSSKSAEL